MINLIYKGFFSKRNTKTYLGILTTLLVILGFLFNIHSIYLQKGNEAYNGSYIYFKSKQKINLTNERNVNEQEVAILANYEGKDIGLIQDFNLPLNYLNLSNLFINNYHKNDVIQITIQNQHLSLQINDFIEDKYPNLDIFYVNIDDLNKENQEYLYLITLQNWYKLKETTAKIDNKYHVQTINVISQNNKIDYSKILLMFSIFTDITGGLFILITGLTIYNIIIDEKANNTLYRYIGYNKFKIFFIMFNKIMLLLLISIATSIIVNVFIYIAIKIIIK